MRKLDIIVGWLLIAFGLTHILLTRTVHPNLDVNAVWFVTGGLLMILIGALNLLRVAYGPVAKGVHMVSLVANLVLMALMLWITTLFPMRSNPQVVVGLVLAILLTTFSVLRRPGHVQAHQVQTAKRSL
ncbi:MAG: hypothetical protein ACRD3E_15310 [Terriglobales bacterium]